MEQFSSFISGLAADDSWSRVSSIKNAMASLIEELGSGIVVESTEYFNHTFAPDLILHWRGENVTRAVYLRATENPEYIREDISTLAHEAPIIVPLTGSWGSQETDSLDADSAEAKTLVAQPSALSEFAEGQAGSPILGLLSKAVAQGGRGVIDGRRARTVSASISDGFVAAQAADIDRTQEAVNTTASILDELRADHFTRLLQAVWVGSGAPASTFPGAATSIEHLGAIELELLLDVATSATFEFWKRIASNVSLETLSETRISTASSNLQFLMKAGLDHFRAKGLRIAATEPGPGSDAGDKWLWFTQPGAVGLQASRFTTFFTPGSISDIDVSDTAETPLEIGLSELLDRARAAEIRVEGLTLEDDIGRQITYRSPAETEIWRDKVLYALTQSLSNRSKVVSATITLQSQKNLKCDMEKMTASGRTGAKFTLSELVQKAIPTLRSLSEQERREISQMHDGE
ncbi:hypothetical protein [Streptomyces goshikiensis]|uniref:hypothetical protein n=1 Tax=Streptomyces goshikiensis TaxID=1942 RepID=UPI0036562072